MDEAALILFAVGGILLLGLATDYLGRHSFLPRVTLLLLLGVVLGEDVAGLIPASLSDSFDVISSLALMIIGFLLGGKLELASLRRFGRLILSISVAAALTVAALVTAAMFAVGLPLPVAILLGCIASATAPAATVDTVLEAGSTSRFATVLLAIVAVDDAWALLLFSLGLSLVGLLAGADGVFESVLGAGREIGGGLLLGVLIGVPASYLTGRIKRGQPVLTEALGLVFLCGGAAILAEVSVLIAVMAMGAAISNLSRHHEYPFHAIESIERPFLAIFFVLAGASLEFEQLPAVGIIGLVYMLARIAGKVGGAWIGGRLGGAREPLSNWIGVAMLSQAGVAIGMALIAAERLPEHGDAILAVVVATTVVFDLFGPVLTRLALSRSRDSA